ncbi:hypothetical protein [Massilia sp. HP4]|uniref:hypothetical protein n=1 Tax=Massilia sp. HP4 TaxID=2562316 RepID=UPI00148597E3|nr:hypothetical protein [Massilia sp. HP4]
MTYWLPPFIALMLAFPAGAEPLRDPFQRPAASRPAAPGDTPDKPPRLRALVLGGARSLANIDGQVLAVGERFSGYTVLRIDARGALLARAGSEMLLNMQDKDSR